MVSGIEDMTNKYPSGKKSAWLALDPELLDRVLNLPDDLMVTAITADVEPPRLRVLVVGPRLREVPMNAESPMLFPRVVHGVDGSVTVDWDATLPEPE